MADEGQPGGTGAIDVAAVDGALRSLVATGDRAVVEVRIRDAAGDAVASHHVLLDAEGCRAATGPADAPDLVLTVGAAAATSIADGSLAPRAVLAAGDLGLAGDPGLLATHAGGLHPRPGAPAGDA